MKKTMLLPALCLVALGFVALSAFSLHQPATLHVPQGEGEDFEAFLAAFPNASFPYVISDKDLRQHLDKAVKDRNRDKSAGEPVQQEPEQLAYRLRKFLPDVRNNDKFSRNPATVEPVHKLNTGKYYAMIYCVSRGFVSTYKSYYVAVLDHTGKHQNTRYLAGLKPEEIISAVLNKELNLTAKTFQVNWEKDYSKNGMKNNKVIGLTLSKTEEIDLTPTGKQEKKPMKKAPDSQPASADKKARAK